MSGLQQQVSTLRFLSMPSSRSSSSSSALQQPQDMTEAALEALRKLVPDLSSLIVQSDVFKATRGGAEHMARDMGIPFLGRVPLDPALSLAGQHLVSWLRSLHSKLLKADHIDGCVTFRSRRTYLANLFWVEDVFVILRPSNFSSSWRLAFTSCLCSSKCAFVVFA